MSYKLIFLLVGLLPICAAAEKVDLTSADEPVGVRVLQSDDLRTVIDFKVNSFEKGPVDIDGQEYFKVLIKGESRLLRASEPELPRICRSIIIPDDAGMKLNVISSKFIDFPQTPILPSKGNLLRTVDPDTVPYTFGPVYQTDTWYPAETAKIRDPYILRDYRGTVVEIYPFQFNPVSNILRVYTEITVEVVNAGPGKINTLQTQKRAESIIPEFDRLYSRHFINYSMLQGKYAPVGERGDMLIITYDDFHPLVEPLAEWKRQKGIKTWIVNVSAIGNDGNLIGAFIKQFYEADSTNLAFVLLVGDNAQVKKPIGSGKSDPVYAKVAGSDDYPDILIGRFSAETSEDVITQVERTVEYEREPLSGDWLHIGTGIGSNDPTEGQDGELDWEHEDLIRDDLLAFTYTEVDRLYENLGASSADLAAALNEGRGIVNYTGHGTATSWSTTGFSNYQVNSLINDDKLPFIFSVACNNGQFDSYTCFAEAWLRATDNGAPSGAVAFYGSLISQSWTPPMDCQDEIVDLLCSRQLNTYGGLCFNGACKMMDMNEDDGVAEYNAWTIFGDPSLMVRTDTPAPLTVEHEDVIQFIAPEFEVITDGGEGALCALYANDILYGSAYTEPDGVAVIPLSDTLPLGEDITLTVTAFNRLPYMVVIPSIAPSTPYIIYFDQVINDAGGNGDGVADAGEDISWGVELRNVGLATAYDVNASISCADSFISITDSEGWFGDIGEVSSVLSPDAYSLTIDHNTPDGHIVSFGIDIADGGTNGRWTDSLAIEVHAPILEIAGKTIIDVSENGNYILDPGETAEMVVTIRNTGSGSADGVIALLFSDDPYLSITDNTGEFGGIFPSGTGSNEFAPFVLSADPACPRGYEVPLRLDLTTALGVQTSLYFTLIIGDRVPIYVDDFSIDRGWSGLDDLGEWTIGPAVGGAGSDSYGDPDPTADHTPTGDNQVLGNDLTPGNGGDYDTYLETTYWVTSPIIDCSNYSGIILDFYRLLGIDNNSRDAALMEVYDGAGWVTKYVNGEAVDDSDWTEMVYDVSAEADGNASFRIRFGIGPTNGWANYRGWNIDDLKLMGYGEWRSAQIGFDTQDFVDSLIPDESITDTFTVFNYNPTTPLEVCFSPDVAWMECTAEPLYINPGGSGEFMFTVEPGGMVPGDYVGHLTYSCNDYIRQYGELSMQLHLYAPDIDVPAGALEVAVVGHGSDSRDLTVYNNGPGRLYYETDCIFYTNDAQPVNEAVESEVIGTRTADDGKSEAIEPYFRMPDRSAGGPDHYGYRWIDSDDPDGPDYSWADISALGMPLSLPDDGSIGPLFIGFDFPFYGVTYDQLYVGSNGIITFGSGNNNRFNVGIPDSTDPNNMIAVWWDDLDPPEGGQIYFYYDNPGRRFIISFEAVQNYATTGGTGSLTFQVILYPDGRILLQYAGMDPGDDTDGLTGATIGLENADGSDGLEVVYNADYMHDQLAILLKAVRWMSVSPPSGIIDPYSMDLLAIDFEAGDLAPGDYAAELAVRSNDPDDPVRTIPVSMTVGETQCGDANSDGEINVADAVKLISYIFKGGAPPEPMSVGDANGDGTVDMADAVYMINHIFKAGPPPIC